jgi:RimJ/RimL family protein N-acetyltransferase
MDARTLRTERLRLEPLRADDAPAMFAGMADAALFAYIDAEPPSTVAALALRYARITAPGAGAPDRWLNWTMRLRATGEPAGLVEVTLGRDGIATIAYFTFARHMRQGLAREACAAVVDALRSDFGAREVVATMDVRNEASWRLAEALGLARDARTEPSSLRGAPTRDYRYRRRL